MPKVRAGSGERWVRNASAATDTFRQGVRNPRVPWAQATIAGAAAQAAGVQRAIADKSFEKGVAAAGDGYWQEKTAGKGGDRFASGVADGKSNYDEGVAPYLSVIESTTLPKRGPKGDPANIQRVAVLASALHNKKRGK